jgi:IclR family transcriptional regulator, KDG regulon repressor
MENIKVMHPARVAQQVQGGVQSVRRALDLLEAFPKYGPEIGLTRIASLLEMNKATAYRLLSTLEERGYVERSPESRKYRLGVRAFELGSYFQSQLELRRTALPFMKAIVEQTCEAAFLCIREGDEALCVERVESQQEVNIFSLRVGGRQPLHCGAAPRALLAGLDDREVAAYAARTGLPGFTPYTITSLEQLLEDIHMTRKRGYVVSMSDVVVGIAAVGTSVYDHSQRVVASISLSGLSSRYGPERVSELASIVVATARRFSRQMGYL